MKKIYKRKHLSKISLICLFILMLISVNSCKKESKADLNVNGLNLPNLFSQLPEKEKIHSKEILDWVKNLPDPLPTEPFWDKAEQKVIVGKHVVRVPISSNASLYFTKQNDSLKVFVYKWIDADPGKQLFTGNIVSYSFQDERLRLLRYNKSKLFKYSTYDEPLTLKSNYSSGESFGSKWINRIWDHFTGKSSKKDAATPSFTLASNKLKSGSKNLKSVTSSAQAQGLIGALWCFLTGGTYEAGAIGSSGGGLATSGHCSAGGGVYTQIAYWIISMIGADGDGAYGDDGSGGSGGGGYIGSTPYNGDPASSGNNTYVPPSSSNGTTGGGGSGGGGTTTTPPLPPYGGGAIWVSRWVPDDPNGCTPTTSDPNTDPNAGSQPGPVGCSTGGGGHWESYQLTANGIASDLINRLGITDSNKQSFLNNNPTIAFELYNYLQEQGDTQDIIDFLNWAVDYLYANPSVTIDVFKNQFLGVSEGTDGPNDFNQSYWDDPNLVIPTQTLPSYQDFYNNFPNIDADAVYNLIGGTVLAHHQSDPTNYSNACALRVSRALNYAGKTIPAVNGTERGADGMNYFLSAKALNAYLRKAFGPPTDHFTKAQGGTNGENFPNLIAGKKGIYSMIASGWVASGHADLFTGTICKRGCDITKFTTTIDVWELQ